MDAQTYRMTGPHLTPPPPADSLFRDVANVPTIPAFKLARRTDPGTSLAAATKAAKASARAVAALRQLFEDGADRTDDEATEQLHRTGAFVSSPNVIRTARKALADAGLIVATGETRMSRYNMPSRVWRRA